MSPLEFMQRRAALVPRPRLHLIRYHGVLAPNATLRARVVPQGLAARARAATEVAVRAECEKLEPVRARAQHIGWAQLLKRVFDIDLQRCPSCGAGDLKIIAAILQRAAGSGQRSRRSSPTWGWIPGRRPGDGRTKRATRAPPAEKRAPCAGAPALQPG